MTSMSPIKNNSDQNDSNEEINLVPMLKSLDEADNVPDSSVIASSPVKRLITMYNSNGEAHKKSRKKSKAINKRVDDIKKTFEEARKEFDELDDVHRNLTDSGDNSPYGGSDDNDCSIDDTLVLTNADALKSRSVKKGLPLSIDISRDNDNDPSEIFWEV